MLVLLEKWSRIELVNHGKSYEIIKIVNFLFKKIFYIKGKKPFFQSKKTLCMVFPIERSHLADSYFRDTGQNVK